MNQAIQPGMHPDGDLLSAFAEQSLTIPERDEITTHLAVCARCREVLFLAQAAAGQEQPAAAPCSEAATTRERQSWFSIWRWAWVPTAAIAGIVGMAVLIHYRNAEAPTQMARNAPESVSNATAASVREMKPESPVEQNKAKEKSARELPQVTGAIRDQKQEAKALNEKDALRRDEEVATPGAVSPAPGGVGGVLTGSGQLSGGGDSPAMHGALASRPTGQAIGGPMAKQYQQQNIPQQPRQAPMQNAVQMRDDLQSYDARKPALAKTAPAPASETVAVEGTPQITPAAPAAKEMTLTPMNTESLDVQAQRTTVLKKAQKITLPSGLGVLSSAVSGGRTIALDSTGALFVYEGSGKPWQPVKTQWSGRAVLVRELQFPTSSSTVFSVVQTPRFELVTDKLQTWVSVDGKTWTAENPLVK